MKDKIRFVIVRYPHGRLWIRDDTMWKVYGFYIGNNGLFIGIRVNIGKCKVINHDV